MSRGGWDEMLLGSHCSQYVNGWPQGKLSTPAAVAVAQHLRTDSISRVKSAVSRRPSTLSVMNVKLSRGRCAAGRALTLLLIPCAPSFRNHALLRFTYFLPARHRVLGPSR